MPLKRKNPAATFMKHYHQFFGLERDPFLDTADPFFYCELGALRRARERLFESVDASRGLTIVLGEPGTGKTSLCSALEGELLQDDATLLGKILDPTFTGEVEFLIAIGRVFGLALPPRSPAALKNALKNFFFETAVLEQRKLVLIIDEAQTLSDENLEALRLLLNYHVPQRKLLNILLFGQPELEPKILALGNLSDRVDGWIRLDSLDVSMAGAILDYRLARAGLSNGQLLFTSDARSMLIAAASGIPRRLTMLAHLALVEAAERGSSIVNEDHVRAAMTARGISLPKIANSGHTPSPRSTASHPGFFARFFARRS